MPETTSSGEPDVGNLHLRFDEGRGVLAALLLYWFGRYSQIFNTLPGRAKA
jgi:hypothetical protein